MMLDHLYCPINNRTCSIVNTTGNQNQEAAKSKEHIIPLAGCDLAHGVMPNCNSNNTYLQHTCIIANTDIKMAQIKHSKGNNDKEHDVDNNSHRLLHADNINDTKNYTPRSDLIENERYEMHNKIEYKYGKEWITRKRKELAYSSSRRAGNLKLKLVRDAREWTEAFGNTISVRVRALAVAGLVLAMLSTCAAEPRDRPTRSIQHEKSARSYLEKFGYLNKVGPEVGNLKAWSEEQLYEDDFKIAIKNLQEFAGIPVTGELDDETLKLMNRRRCGRPDIESNKDETNTRRRKRFAIQGDKWVHTNLTWSLSSVSRPSQLDPYGTRAVLARALDVWAQASRLTFQEINSDEADIVVSFARGFHDDAYPFDGRGSILAHAFFPGTGRGGDAHFDDDELWLLQPKNDEEEGTSLLAVAAHEFGHSLGLSHSSVVGALMYPYYQGIQPNFVLPEDDRNGIQQLYGPKEKRTWAKIPYHRPVETPPPTTTTTTTTTTTRRPYIHHRTIRPDRRHNYNPYHPRVNHYPANRPNIPRQPGHTDGPSSPERPYHPRHYDTSDEHPRRAGHHPHTTEPTTYAPYRPRYPSVQPDYPRSNYPANPRPNYPKYDYPKKKPYIPVKTTTERVAVNTPSDKPDTCDTSYDAVALIRGELFIFKDKYHWRIGANGRYLNYPLEIVKMWTALPNDLTHVDAVYERPDRNIAFFIGKQLYLFDSRELIRGYPKSLAELGLPDDLEKIDAAMVWGHNGKTYFYSGNLYWKYDESEGRVELDYPRDMIMWKGVGYNIDSVFQWKDGKTYFFKGKGYWKFNDLQMRVENERQHPSAPFWMGCPTKRTDPRLPGHSPPAPESTIRSPSSASVTKVSILLPFFCSIFMVFANNLR